MSTHPDAPRIIQSNEVAAIVIEQARQVHPDLFVTLDLRYGIADALWAAGYRKQADDWTTGVSASADFYRAAMVAGTNDRDEVTG